MTLFGHQLPTRCCCISNDEKILVTGSNDETLQIWSISKNGLALLKEISSANQKRITSCHISIDNNFLISGGVDGAVKVWNLQKMLSDSFHQFL